MIKIKGMILVCGSRTVMFVFRLYDGNGVDETITVYEKRNNVKICYPVEKAGGMIKRCWGKIHFVAGIFFITTQF